MIALGGGGNDTIVSRAPQVYRVFGGAGDDRISFEGVRGRVGLWFRFGGVEFTKGLEFRTRANALPRKRKRRTVTIRGRTRTVPCT